MNDTIKSKGYKHFNLSQTVLKNQISKPYITIYAKNGLII